MTASGLQQPPIVPTQDANSHFLAQESGTDSPTKHAESIQRRNVPRPVVAKAVDTMHKDPSTTPTMDAGGSQSVREFMEILDSGWSGLAYRRSSEIQKTNSVPHPKDSAGRTARTPLPKGHTSGQGATKKRTVTFAPFPQEVPTILNTDNVEPGKAKDTPHGPDETRPAIITTLKLKEFAQFLFDVLISVVLFWVVQNIMMK
ncbi:hypothetical protein DFH27DRAFT_609832 [Peziza echinospora]|nr:hypothetical protein DFH27DRAFT_609832 [Peziza echinospora]